MKLLICESPIKAKTISKFLSNDFLVLSTKGHLFELAKNNKYNLGINLNDYSLNWVPIQGQKKTISLIKKSLKDSTDIFLGTDPDREGEAISYHILNFIVKNKEECEKKCKRVVFHEINKKSIIKAIEAPTSVNEYLVKAQNCRRAIDRIIGFRLSNFFWKKFACKSVGRVQSVILRLICENEEKIESFVKIITFKLFLHLKNGLILNYLNKSSKTEDSFSSKDEINEVASNLSDFATLEDIKENIISSNKYLPLTTAKILILSFQKFGYPTKKTTFILQSLFEGVSLENEQIGLITYPRTDLNVISDEFAQKIKLYIENKYGQNYFWKDNKNVKKIKKNVQGAHEAIRATDLSKEPEKIANFLSKEQLNIYRLIFEHTVIPFITPTKNLIKTLTFKNNNYFFQVKITKNLFPGQNIVLNQEINDPLANYDFLKNKKYFVANSEIKEYETKPPSRLSEGKIISILENLGIGRPSTYSEIINKVKKSQYIIFQKNLFFPTIRGKYLIEKINKFFPFIIDYKYTSNLELKFDEISEKKIEYFQVVNEIFLLIDKNLLDYKSVSTEKNIPLNHDCPECKTGKLLLKSSKFSDFVGCSNFPKCKFTTSYNFLENKIFFSKTLERKCPKCGGTLVTKWNSNYLSEYISCKDCDYKEIINKEKNLDT
ncbi:type I DNA topoisomerase [symbiont of Argiope bruennichi]|uniref:type I DNA topoisomerase n=1 Tax=symbiont of Argiope bruennichi TaxID=2810479 RepID=UPI003DA5E45E